MKRKLQILIIINFIIITANAQSLAAGENHSLFLCNNSNMMSTGWNQFGQLADNTIIDKSMPVLTATSNFPFTNVNCGWRHSLFLKNDSTVWASGLNSDGQLGDGTNTDKQTPIQVSNLTKIIAIAGGRYHSLFLKNDSTVWGCGTNMYGQLGGGLASPPINIATQVPGINGVIDIAAGDDYSIFLKSNGTVWTCGYNNNGQLGMARHQIEKLLYR